MPWNPIIKSRRDWETIPNLHDYATVREGFSWEQARAELDGLPEGEGINIAHEAVVRHADSPLASQAAIRWLGKSGQAVDYSYARLDELTNRFANTLQGLGVTKGDRVFVLAGRIPELYITALGTLKHRAVFCPLFSAFGPEPIRARLMIGQAKVLVTTESLYQRKVAGIRDTLPHLEHVLLIGDQQRPNAAPIPGTQPFHPLLDQTSPTYRIGPTDPEDPALLHFTSGTTGTPKGALHVHAAVVAHHITGKLALD